MSVDLIIYVPSISQDLHEKVLLRLRKLSMECEFPPGFAFDGQEENTGFIPIRWKVNADDPAVEYAADYKGMDIATGFEIYISDFNYEAKLTKLQKEKQPGLLEKVFGKKEDRKPLPTYLANENVDRVLKNCTKEILFVFHSTSGPSSLHLGNYIAAILAELAQGVVYDPQIGAFDAEEDEQSYFESKDDLEGRMGGIELDSAAEEPFEGW